MKDIKDEKSTELGDQDVAGGENTVNQKIGEYLGAASAKSHQKPNPLSGAGRFSLTSSSLSFLHKIHMWICWFLYPDGTTRMQGDVAFFLKFIPFWLKDNCFTILYCFLSYTSRNQSCCTLGTQMSSSSWTSLPPPTSSHPTRLLQSPSLSSLNHTVNSFWPSVLHMIVYMFPCYSAGIWTHSCWTSNSCSFFYWEPGGREKEVKNISTGANVFLLVSLEILFCSSHSF